MGRVYVVGGGSGPIKIGSTSSTVQGRIAQLQTAYPHRLRSYGSWRHDRHEVVEGQAHSLLKQHRLVGEWFSVPPSVAREAVQKAIRLVDGTEKPEIPKPVPIRFSIPDQPHVPAADDRHRVGYAKGIHGCDEERQIEWMLASGVASVDIYLEEARGRKARDYALRDARDGDLLLVWSPAVFGRAKPADGVTMVYAEPLWRSTKPDRLSTAEIADQVGLSVKTLYVELGRRPDIKKGRSK